MHRRHLLLSVAAVCLAGPAGASYTAQTFTPAVWDAAREQGAPVILNFRASWSLTCQITADVIAEVLAENPAYAGLTIIDVNWDTFGPSELVRRLGVDRRSTLLVMKRGKEVARLVNAPYRRKIKALFDTALQA